MATLFRRPHFEVGVDGLQPFVVSLALSLLAISIFSTISRVVFGRRRGEGIIELSLNTLATFLAFAHTAVLIRACNAGLGKHDQAQSPGLFDRQSQLRYTMELLSTVALCCSKGSAAAIVHQLIGFVHRRMQYGLLLSTSLFIIFAPFAVAFQCSGNAPQYWAYTSEGCEKGGLQYAVLVFGILTDSWIALVALPIVWRLQIILSTRVKVMTLLGARMLVVVAGVAQLVSVATLLDRPNDRSWSQAIIVSYATVTTHLSILTANLPILSTWIDDLVSGHNGTHITHRETGFDLTDFSHRSNPNAVSDTSKNTKSRRSGLPTVPALGGGAAACRQADRDGDSDQDSQTGILKTTAFEVHNASTEERPRSTGSDGAHAQAHHRW